jgi:hypothetical protein
MAASVLTSAMTGAVLSLINALQGIAGYPIVVLDRNPGTDPSVFWHAASTKLCSATGENWCDDDLVFITDTTNQLGWSRLVNYQGRTSGQQKTVCMILPPADDVSPWMVAQGLSSGAYQSIYDLPTNPDAWVWLMLNWAGDCIADADLNKADRRAQAFATLGLGLIDADPISTQQNGIAPARWWQNFKYHDLNRWAANLTERYSWDIWKNQVAAAATTAIGCTMTIVPNTDTGTDVITRDPTLQPADGCAGFGGGTTAVGNVTDANLWIWMYQSPIGAPPLAWQPYQGFADWNAAVRWTWGTANDLATQYPQ